MQDKAYVKDKSTLNPNVFFKKEILYRYKVYLINNLICDEKIVNSFENSDDVVFNLYDDIPKKISLIKLIKYKKAIVNFIIYQYHLKANTFIERKILKEVKTEVNLIYTHKAWRYNTLTYLLGLATIRTFIGKMILLTFLTVNLITPESIPDLILLCNSNNILMKYQINSYYKLGRETKDFVDYLNSAKDETQLQYKRDKDYYEKFFNNFEEIKFEREDVLYDYLKPTKSTNFYEEIVNSMQKYKKV